MDFILELWLIPVQQPQEETMPQQTNPTYISWLQDALVMEQTLVGVLEQRIEASGDFPEVQQMDRLHLTETKEHVTRIEQCLERLGSGPSTSKSMMSSLMAAMEKPAKALMKDEVIKNCLQDYGAECFEVACYTSLIAAATTLGDQETVTACQQNLQQDQAMAERILAGIPSVTVVEMERSVVDATT
jgi:ferritin-like metal-binding protein YciE